MTFDELVIGTVQMLFGSSSIYLQLLRFTFVLLIGILVTRTVLVPVIRRIVNRRGADKKAKHSLESMASIFGVFAAFIAALQAGEFGSLVTVIGTVAAALTVAIGWGMRDQVGSLVYGTFLHVYPSFIQGDYITVGDVSGTIREIKLTETRIRGDHGDHIAVPNNYLSTRPIKNQTRGTATQDHLTIKLDPAKLEEATETLRTVCREYDEVLNTPKPKIQYSTLTKDAVETELIYYVDDSKDLHDIRSTVIQRFNAEAVENNYLGKSEEKKDEDTAA